MTIQPIYALANAIGCNTERATAIMERLHQQGFTVYRKKVSKNRRRPATATPMSESLAAKIRAYYFDNPEVTQQEIANIFAVNIGRVNEALSTSIINAA